MSKISLTTEIVGIKLRNPTMNAAGVLGMSAPLLKRLYDAGAGAVITKSIGSDPRCGHGNPTMVSLKGGFLNAMGLPNPGIDNFINEIKVLKRLDIPLIASFFGSNFKDFENIASKLSEVRVDALELNLSCPNVEDEIGMLAADSLNVKRVTRIVKSVTNKPVFVKLSPNVTDIAEIAIAAEKGGADAITAVNTLKAMAVDIDFQKPILTNITGGLSGPALKPVALRCIWEITENVKIPVIGCGGISNWRDAIEFILSGAVAIEIGSAINTHGLNVFKEINEGIKKYLEAKNFTSLTEVVGLAHKC